MVNKILNDLDQFVKMFDLHFTFIEAKSTVINYELNYSDFASCYMHFSNTTELPNNINEFIYSFSVNEDMVIDLHFKLIF